MERRSRARSAESAEDLRPSYCDVRPAGREGDVSLWLVDCGSGLGPTVGWDERTRTLLQDEQLYERVPRLRSVPPYGTARP